MVTKHFRRIVLHRTFSRADYVGERSDISLSNYEYSPDVTSIHNYHTFISIFHSDVEYHSFEMTR